jgi:hypothetical protein
MKAALKDEGVISQAINAKEGVLGEVYDASHHLCEGTCGFITQVPSSSLNFI